MFGTLVLVYQHFDYTFFKKLNAFLMKQRRKRKATDSSKKLNGTMNDSSAKQQIHKSNVTVHIL